MVRKNPKEEGVEGGWRFVVGANQARSAEGKGPEIEDGYWKGGFQCLGGGKGFLRFLLATWGSVPGFAG